VREFLRFAYFLLGALVLFGASSGLYWEQYYAALEQEGKITAATVTRITLQDASALRTAKAGGASIHFAFRTASGQTIQSKRSLPAAEARALHEGAEIAIRYLPQSPHLHEIVALAHVQHETGLGRWLQYLMLAFVGSGLMFWVSDTPRLKKPRMNVSLDDLMPDAQPTATVSAVAALGIVKRYR
jgi:hypothetical protein